MFTRPLDWEPLMETVAGQPPRPQADAGLSVGHVHLHVNDLEAARDFYVGVLGFDTMADLGSADFLAAGGYHHHLGINVWRGEGIAGALDADSVVGLRHWTIALPSVDDVSAVRTRVSLAGHPLEDQVDGFLVRDPAGIAIRVTTSD
jgi:catechol 2,3-dioxygenase